MKTVPIKDFVEEVLSTLPGPPGEDIIDEVFQAIEENPTWRRRYGDLCDEFTKNTVNQMGGWWVSKAVGLPALRQVDATKSHLIGSYSKLRR